MGFLRIGLASSLSRSLFIRPSSVESIVGFPLRIRAFKGIESYNLYRSEYSQNDYVVYISDDGYVNAFWYFVGNFGELTTDGGLDLFFAGPTLASVPTDWPSTGWSEGWQFGLSSPTLVTLSYVSPQSFVYSNSIPSPAFTSSPAIASNLFAVSGLSSENAGSQNAVISMEKADYYLAAPVTIPVTITKRNVTLSINNQSSTYSPNATYNWFSAVGISTLAAGDTIQGRFNSNLLTGVPATNANAGSYTISFNPNYTSTNYNITNSPASATWTIGKANQTISFNPSGTALTTDSTNLSASSTSGLAVSFSVVSGPGSINGSTLTYSGAGSVVVRASQAGNTNYNAATNVDRTITISAPQAGGSGISTSTQTIYIGGFIVDGFLDLTNPVPLFRQSASSWALGNGHSSNPTNAHISLAYVPNQNGWYVNLQNSHPDEGYYYMAASNSAGSSTIPTTGWVLASAVATGTFTITAPSGIPVATTNEIIVTDPTNAFTGNYLKDGQGTGGYQPGGGDNGLFYDVQVSGKWAFYNSDSGRIRTHPTATNPDFIPETGWEDGITITAA